MFLSQHKASLVAAGVFVALGLAGTVPAQAQVTLTPGNNPQPDEQNVLLNKGETGTTIFGLTNQTQTLVQFTSTTDTLTAPANGQARVEAVDTILNNVTVSVPDGTFGDLIFNAFIGGQPKIDDGLLSIVAATSAGSQTFTQAIGNGQNFFTVVANTGVRINSITLSSTTGFNDLRQVRISGVQGGQVIPEPGTLALAGTGLLPLAGAVLRKRRRSA